MSEEKRNVLVKFESEFLQPNSEGNVIGALGDKISGFEKISKIPKNVTKMSQDGLLDIYTPDGVRIAYDDDSYRKSRYGNGLDFKEDVMKKLNKEWVQAEALYFEDNDENDVVYAEFSVDAYSKFVYLFGKEKVLYRLSY